jgi:arylsulfatase
MEIELYNLKIDPTEQQNVAQANPEVVKQIEQIMKQEHTEPEIEKFKIEQLGDKKETVKTNS